MKRIIVFLFLTFLCNRLISQNIEVKEGSFRKIEGYVMMDKHRHTDDNNAPMALIKITTENIKAEERKKFIFKGNLATYFDVEFHPGEIYVYISAAAATFMEIIHDDYGKCEYWFPYDLQDFCGYEMVVRKKGGFDEIDVPDLNYLIISADHDDAAIYIDDNYVGDKEASRSFEIGTRHTWRIECKMYHTESGEAVITQGDAVEINRNMRPAYGFMEVTSSPETNAAVFINGERVGNTPFKSDKMPSGEYTVKVVKEMYEPIQQTFVVNDNETTKANLILAANFSDVTITTDAQSDIYLDNEYKGKGMWKGRVSEGAHYVEVRKENHRNVVNKYEFKKGENMKLEMEAPHPINGHLDINSSPMKADIYIDGVHYGATPKVITNVLIGKHKLRLEKEGCATLTKDIVIEEGKTLSLNEKLSTGKEVAISTGQNGDKIYVDANYVGVSPLTTNVAYGSHEIKATRGSQTATKNIDVRPDNAPMECVMSFGKIVKITSPEKGDNIYVDGKKVGSTPMDIDFSLGSHEVTVRRGKLYETKTLTINRNTSSAYYFVPKKVPLEKYLDRGVSFVTLNVAYSASPQTSFGLTYGHVKKVGWFVSVMSGLDFSGFNTVDKNYGEVVLTGETASTRLSVMGGVVARIGGPVYFKAGAGYGMRVRCCETISGDYVEYPDNTYKGVDLGLGLQFNLRNITFGIDAVTTNFKHTEMKFGIGVNFN